MLGLQHRRVQFTVDVLPSDITGSSIYRQSEQNFEFHPGPIFSQILLADEINRAMPKTQSALLEAMEENAVSQDGITYPLPSPFFVIATQNLLHHSGNYPLPESQLDRFLMTLQMGYPSADAELVLLTGEPTRQKVLDQSALCTPEQLLGWQAEVRAVKVASAIANYVLRLVRQSRGDALFEMGLSPRWGSCVDDGKPGLELEDLAPLALAAFLLCLGVITVGLVAPPFRRGLSQEARWYRGYVNCLDGLTLDQVGPGAGVAQCQEAWHSARPAEAALA